MRDPEEICRGQIRDIPVSSFCSKPKGTGLFASHVENKVTIQANCYYIRGTCKDSARLEPALLVDTVPKREDGTVTTLEGQMLSPAVWRTLFESCEQVAQEGVSEIGSNAGMNADGSVERESLEVEGEPQLQSLKQVDECFQTPGKKLQLLHVLESLAEVALDQDPPLVLLE